MEKYDVVGFDLDWSFLQYDYERLLELQMRSINEYLNSNFNFSLEYKFSDVF